ncbi:HAD-IA family hydrolase [Candidatus Micrarchaeota archaeon]|nr:HAD-IA family hydrolase [Candidatus Micrarchaeota archaeon]
MKTTQFKAILSDMDGVIRTVPFHYLHYCVVQSLKSVVSDPQRLSREWVADLSSSNLFVNDPDGFLEFCFFALSDTEYPLDVWQQQMANTTRLFQYLDHKRKTEGPIPKLNVIALEYHQLRHGPVGQKQMKPIKGALDGVRRILNSGIPFCIVSNSPKASIRTWFEKQGVRPEHIIGSDDVMLQKPHPEGLLEACRMLGVTPGRHVAYAGDLPNDVAAARAATVSSVGIAYADRVARLKSAKPDFIFSGFSSFADYAIGNKVDLKMEYGIAISPELI